MMKGDDGPFVVVFPGGEIPLEFRDIIDWDRDDIEVISVTELHRRQNEQ